MTHAIGLQLDLAWEDKPENYRKVREMLESAPPPPGSLVVLPEMFPTGFSMNVREIAEGPERETDRFYAEVAQRYGVFVLGGMVKLGSDGRGRNEAAAFGPDGREVARYCKIHPFTYGGETDHYSSGCEVVTFEWAGFTVAPFICYDLRFPEIFRHAARRGADLFAVIANWPQPREAHWVTLLQARAIENQAYVVGVNRCGHDPKLAYSGRSLIIDPRGAVLADGGNTEGVISADLDPEALQAYRRQFPALSDMRNDFLGSR